MGLLNLIKRTKVAPPPALPIYRSLPVGPSPVSAPEPLSVVALRQLAFEAIGTRDETRLNAFFLDYRDAVLAGWEEWTQVPASLAGTPGADWFAEGARRILELADRYPND